MRAASWKRDEMSVRRVEWSCLDWVVSVVLCLFLGNQRGGGIFLRKRIRGMHDDGGRAERGLRSRGE